MDWELLERMELHQKAVEGAISAQTVGGEIAIIAVFHYLDAVAEALISVWGSWWLYRRLVFISLCLFIRQLPAFFFFFFAHPRSRTPHNSVL